MCGWQTQPRAPSLSSQAGIVHNVVEQPNKDLFAELEICTKGKGRNLLPHLPGLLCQNNTRSNDDDEKDGLAA
jgi:hypothetical protein